METIQSNKKELDKQQSSTKKIDNRLKSLIKRHPGFRHKYIERIQKYLADNGHRHYKYTAIWRIVTDKVPLNAQNIVIKEAVEHLVDEFEGQLNA